MGNIRVRTFLESNYKSIFYNGKTIRMPINPSKEVSGLNFPEFYDIKITNKCSGNCNYCYQDSIKGVSHYTDILTKCKIFFGSLSHNEKPFQVAIGGGNPNEHPEFISILQYLHSIAIMPNYTTNGIGLTENIIEATKTYCGGVAVTCHLHMKDIWEDAVKLLYDNGIMVNLHVLISDLDSIEDFTDIYSDWQDKVDYFVLLPLIPQGRGKDIQVKDFTLTTKTLLNCLKNLDSKKIAFGANFYSYIKDENHLDISLYEPEIFSKYLDMNDMIVYKSSFNLEKVS